MKDQHYWTELRAALTAGKWDMKFPAKTPSGTALSWADLLRKFRKHCNGFDDVAEIASRTRDLALLLETDSTSLGQNVLNFPPEGCFNLSDECLLLEERIEEAKDAYDALKKLETSNFDVLNFALAYYAYALRRPAECLFHLAKVPYSVDVLSHIPTIPSTNSNNPALPVPLSVIDGSLSSWAGSFISSDSVYVSEIKDGRAWAMVGAIQSICLQGMSNEKLAPDDPHKALEAYGCGLSLLTVIEAEIPYVSPVPSVPASTAAGMKHTFPSFTTFRELWSWVDRLLWRAIILAARTKQDLWTWLPHYSACNKYWPPQFRTEHRSTINTIYLRALVLTPPFSRSQNCDSGKPPWLQTARSVINEYRAVLNVSTFFPRAGQRNVKVEEFIDLCVAVWECSGASGDYAGWVIDVLWWATRLTFNSSRIFRHMTRLFYASGDVELAKRTLRLYAQVVSKAFETGGVGVDRVDEETDKEWVETLVQGARMLCRLASAPGKGLDGISEAKEAGELLQKAKARLDMNDIALSASVDLAEGIWQSIMALKEEDPHTRPERLSQCITLLVRSIEKHPTASGYHHLALALARPGSLHDLNQAIVNAGKAVETEAKEVRHWHLLGLLLTKAEEWKAAKGAFDEGAALGEESTFGEVSAEGSDSTSRAVQSALESDTRDSVDEDEDGDSAKVQANGVTHLLTPEHTPARQQNVIDPDAVAFQPAALLLAPVRDHPAPSPLEVFEHSLQLRMTQVALTEYVEGPENAGLKWFEVFKWISGRKGFAYDHHRSPVSPMNLSRLSVDLKPPSELILHPDPEKGTGYLNPPQHTSERESLLAVPPHNKSIKPTPPAVSPIEEFPRSSGSDQDNTAHRKSLSSIDKDTKGKRVQRMLRNRVHKGQVSLTTNIKRLGGVRNGSANLRRSLSAPDFNFLVQHSTYQASSIHSRKRLRAFIKPHHSPREESPPPPPPPTLPPASVKLNSRMAKEKRLESDLWLMSAATFRRQGNIEQAKGAIQEAEVRDEGNPAVWTQLGLYYAALGHNQNAIDAFHKALFICPDNVPASVHLCQLYLAPSSVSLGSQKSTIDVDPNNVDLASGILSHLTRGRGWDVAEAWYYLAKAFGLQGRKDREQECLNYALELSEKRGLRDIGTAIGYGF